MTAKKASLKKDKSLKKKAIKIKGNEYVLVSDRVIYFNETHVKGHIQTRLLSDTDAELVVVKAKVTPDYTMPTRYFTGYSQAKWGMGMVNKTAALENAETSAVGRALAFMGIGVIDSVASKDEMVKAGATSPKPVDDEPGWVQEESSALKENIEDKTCQIHQKEMYQSKYKKGEYGHVVQGKWCTGKGINHANS